MESSTSAVVEPQIEQMQVQKSKKKSKNKKQSTATMTTKTIKANNSDETTDSIAVAHPPNCTTNGASGNVNGLAEFVDNLHIVGNGLTTTDTLPHLANGNSAEEAANTHKSQNGHHHANSTLAACEQRPRKSKSKNIESKAVEEVAKEEHCHKNAIIVANGLENGFNHRNEDCTVTDININTAEPTILTATAKQSEASSEVAQASASSTIPPASSSPAFDLSKMHIEYTEYQSELQMHDIMRLIQAELSEPYSIYTYRYFIYNWPKLCFLAAHGKEYVGAIVCKLDMHMNVKRGYIAMLAVRKEYRNLKIGSTLVQMAIEAMLKDNADEVVLETEMRNYAALHLYENLGFVRDKRLFRYYLNGVDALRLKLWFR